MYCDAWQYSHVWLIDWFIHSLTDWLTDWLICMLCWTGDWPIEFQSENLPGCALVTTQRFLRGEPVSRRMRVNWRPLCRSRRGSDRPRTVKSLQCAGGCVCGEGGGWRQRKPKKVVYNTGNEVWNLEIRNNIASKWGYRYFSPWG